MTNIFPVLCIKATHLQRFSFLALHQVTIKPGGETEAVFLIGIGVWPAKNNGCWWEKQREFVVSIGPPPL